MVGMTFECVRVKFVLPTSIANVKSQLKYNKSCYFLRTNFIPTVFFNMNEVSSINLRKIRIINNIDGGVQFGTASYTKLFSSLSDIYDFVNIMMGGPIENMVNIHKRSLR